MTTYTGHNITTAPVLSPVTLEEARSQLRNEDITFDDDYILTLIDAAVSFIEKRYSLAIMEQTVTEYHSGFPVGAPLMLEVTPVKEVSAITYLDSGGTGESVSPSSVRVVEKYGRKGLVPVLAESWPTPGTFPDAVTIEYTAGWATADEVPQAIKRAILIMVTDWYTKREDQVRTLPTVSETLLGPWYKYNA